jgi:hypothetical protein
MSRPWRKPNKLDLIISKLDNLEKIVMTSQEEIDAEVAILTADEATMKAGFAALQAEIVTLEGQGVDVTGLKAVEALFTADAATDAPVVPAPAA